MGAFKAYVSIDGGPQHDVMYTSTRFFRLTDQKGKPTTRIQGGEIEFRIEAEAGSEIAEKMVVNEHKMIGLQLDYIQTEDNQIMRSTIGENGYIIDYKEMLDVTDGQQAQIYFKCRFTTLTVGGATHVQEWKMNS